VGGGGREGERETSCMRRTASAYSSRSRCIAPRSQSHAALSWFSFVLIACNSRDQAAASSSRMRSLRRSASRMKACSLSCVACIRAFTCHVCVCVCVCVCVHVSVSVSCALLASAACIRALPANTPSSLCVVRSFLGPFHLFHGGGSGCVILVSKETYICELVSKETYIPVPWRS
jgi:hypothetical protein